MSKGKKIGGIILIVIGTILMVIGLGIGGIFGMMNSATGELESQMDEFRETSVSTYGEITGIDSEGMSTIEYYCEEDGYWYETYIMVLSDQYRVGSAVEVLYDPGDPTNVMVPELLMDGMGAIGGVGIGVGVVFGLIGLLLLIIGIVLLVTNKKDKQWTDDIKARNAAHGIGGGQFNGYQQMPGGQPLSGYQQPGGQNGYASNQNAYQQNNNQNM